MRDGLLQLLKLQEVDKELQTLEEAKETYPAEIEDHQKALDHSQTALQEWIAKLDELEKQRRHFEREIEVAQASLKEHEERFSVVTNNKEYDALQLEIEACKADISECEARTLELIEAAERLREQVEIEKQEFEKIRENSQEEIAELQNKFASLEGAVKEIHTRRQLVLSDIDEKLLKTYERSRKRRGLRVAPVRKGACGGCFRELPAQQRSDVRHSEEIHYCESCGTLLVWDEESS